MNGKFITISLKTSFKDKNPYLTKLLNIWEKMVCAFWSYLIFFLLRGSLIVGWFGVWTKKLLELISFNFCNSNHQDLIKSSYKCWLLYTKRPFIGMTFYNRMKTHQNNIDNELFVLCSQKLSYFSWMNNTTEQLKRAS